MENKPLTIEQDMLKTLDNISRMVFAIDQSNSPQLTKDESKKILNQCTTMINDELSPLKINQLVMTEYRKTHNNLE